jgi:hypothetical protein
MPRTLMLSLPGIVSLIVAVYLRPHEWTGPFAAIPFLQIAMGLTVVGLLADIALGSARLVAAPTLLPAALLTVWCLITLALREPGLVSTRAPLMLLPFAVHAILTQAAQSARALTVVSVALLLTGLFIAVIGADQGRSEWGCIQFNPNVSNDRGVSDGRACPVDEDHTPVEAAAACSVGGEIDAVYRCERVGAFSMVTVDSGRIAYLGVLADPNELALAISLAVPFAFALFEIRKTVVRFVLLLASLGFIITALVLTRSRGGQLALGAVFGAYFVRRHGKLQGALVAAAFVAPLALLGGRASDSAAQSSLDRLTTAGAGLKLLLAYPIRGVGYSLYTVHHPLTAHNAYILAAAELGIFGMVLFCLLLLLSFKISFAILHYPFARADPDARALRALAMAELAALAGLSLGVFFLSWTYHFVLWIHLGFSGAFFTVMQRKDPRFTVRATSGELAAITVLPLVGFAVYAVHIARMGCW